VNLGRLFWSYPWVWPVFPQAGSGCGDRQLGTHAIRHSYRSWLDTEATAIAVQQRLMRHASIGYNPAAMFDLLQLSFGAIILHL
jgi:hypothetical protein